MEVIEYSALRQVDGYLIAYKDTPVIDAEPVVRCRDCKHNALRRSGDGRPENSIICYQWGIGRLPGDGYCFMGVRREDNGNGV